MNGPELRQWRKLLGYTQEQAANEFGVTRPTIQNWEYEVTSVPAAVDLASRQLLRRWKQRPEFGPVTLVHASAPLGPKPNVGDRLPTLSCKRYTDNKSALLALSALDDGSKLFNPQILDETNLVIWSGPQLMEECKKLARRNLQVEK
jgi:transcriptional regulator with XRE-family HTH domain